jgi:hypothetical protein
MAEALQRLSPDLRILEVNQMAEEGITLNFVDLWTSDAATIVMHPANDGVALAVSLMKDGDIEVFMPKAIAQELARALAKAAE